MNALVVAGYSIKGIDPSVAELIASYQPSIVASVAAAALPIPFPDFAPEALFHLNLPDFGLHLAAPITDFHLGKASGRVTLQTSFNNDAIIAMTLRGTLTDAFHIDEVSIDIRALENTPRAEFISSTLFALLGLSGETYLQIPAIGLDLRQSFDLSLKRISQRLQMRQTAFRLMVIERATGLELSVPESYSGEDIETIAYLYRAIVLRSFVWPIGTVTVHVPATVESLELFPKDNMPTRQQLGPTRVVKNLFGHTIDLGEEELFLDDAVFENLAAVRSELARNDRHPVEVVVRPLSGKGMVALKNSQRLPEPTWHSSIQALIDLEPHLDQRLADRYNALAASTLDNLTEEAKKEVTARAELDEEALLSDDYGGETI